ncbi:hypothetical protein [Nonlabens antarcticus]|uniref:hypothetical protein n=1 Tax=Nonlabens antarcticus TaxID=392714 RepID=UPI001890EC67|nr:hypothetical protein [Nonlabens antarcticus]
MKQIIFFITLIVSSTGVAQGENEQIKTDFQKYSNALKSKQFTQATSYMPDAIFDVVSKQQLVQEMKNTLDSSETEIKINGIVISGFGTAMNVGNTDYVPFNFTQKFDIKYLNLFDATDDEQSRNSTTKFIVQMLNESMPESNVSFDKSTEVFKVSSLKQAVAVKTNGSANWKFVVIEAQLRSELASILPAAVVKKLN